jgi:uncharacterized phosphosugar-binding protein
MACAEPLSRELRGLAEHILRSFHFGPHDAFIVISTSGIRPVIVEMAMGAQERGLPVIAIVSKAHSEEAKAAHSSGKKLTDCAELVIDNLCPPGDCVLELDGLEWRTRAGVHDHRHGIT